MRELVYNFDLRAGLTVLLLLAPLTGAAQEVRDVVSNRLAIGGDEATLLLEFADGEDFQVSLAEGEVRVDGELLGSYTPGDRVDTSWRALLGGVTTLSNGALARALRDWTPPEDLEEGSMAHRLDDALEEALRAVETAAADGVVVRGSSDPLDPGTLLRSMLRPDLVPALAEALEGVEMADLRFYVDEDVTLTERVDGPVMMIGGHLTVAEEIDGDVVVVRGSLTLDPGAHVLGDVKLVDSRLHRDGGTLMGDVEELDEVRMRDELRRELREELRSELRSEFRSEFDRRDAGRGLFSPLAGVVDGIANIFGDLVTFMILAAMGLAVVFLARDNLEVVAETARRSPGRSAMVGLAGGFLVLPVWLLGTVALVISVVGIIALPFWVVLFPLAVALAAGLGYYAVARNIGEWVARQRFNGLQWLRASNAAYAVVAGVGAIIAFSAVGHLVGIVPGLGLFEGLFTSLGSIAAFAAGIVGFGAVLLTRGGRQPEFYGASDPFDSDLWTPEPDPGRTRDFRDAPEAAPDQGATATAGTAPKSGTGEDGPAKATSTEEGNDA